MILCYSSLSSRRVLTVRELCNVAFNELSQSLITLHNVRVFVEKVENFAVLYMILETDESRENSQEDTKENSKERK